MQAYNYEQDYRDALIHELEDLLAQYNDRIVKNNNSTDKHHIVRDDVLKMIGLGASIGAAVGTAIPIPGAGNAIGAAAGVGLAAGIAGIIEVHYRRQNKKIDNADRVRRYLDHNTLQQAATEVIADRANAINTLANPNQYKKQVVKYLAVNMIAGIKHNNHIDDNNKIQAIKEGLTETRSKKVLDNKKIGLKSLARR